MLTRLDYSNALLAGLPYSTVAPLQRVINTTTRLLYGLQPRDHVTDGRHRGVALAADRRADTVQTVCSSTGH